MHLFLRRFLCDLASFSSLWSSAICAVIFFGSIKLHQHILGFVYRTPLPAPGEFNGRINRPFAEDIMPHRRQWAWRGLGLDVEYENAVKEMRAG
jgi:hypothetical protein